MTSIFFEIKELFLRERLYRFLLVVIIVFYIAAFFLQKAASETNSVVKQNMEEVKQLLNEAPVKSELIEKKISGKPWLFWSVQVFSFSLLIALGTGLWFDVISVKRLLKHKDLIPRARRTIHITWGISEVIRVMILFFCLGIALNLVFSIYLAVSKLFFDLDIDRSFLMLVHTFLLDVGTMFLILFWIWKSGGTLKDLIGFNFSKFPVRETLCGIRTYLLILPVLAAILLLLVWIAGLFHYEPSAHPLVNVLLKDEKIPYSVLIISLILACVVGPAMEEVFFRGFFYPALRRYWNAMPAMMVTAGLFALVHENLFAFFPIFFLGLVLTYLYEKRANLASCISLHVLHNTMFIVYFFLMRSILIGAK